MANLVTLQGEDQPFIQNVMTLNSCSSIVGVDVMPFDTEREVLLAWRVWFYLYTIKLTIRFCTVKFYLLKLTVLNMFALGLDHRIDYSNYM